MGTKLGAAEGACDCSFEGSPLGNSDFEGLSEGTIEGLKDILGCSEGLELGWEDAVGGFVGSK